METLDPKGTSRRDLALRIVTVVGFLILFLVGIKLLGASFKMVGKDTADSLFNGLSNPIAGLAVGILATVLVQSSSVTTSIVVGLVGSGEISVAHAVPVIMGANIGTSVTNTLVSLGHITRSAEFRRAFAGATMHDFFNLLAVIVLLPLELMTGFLQKSAEAMTGWLGATAGVSYKSPIKVFIGSISKPIIKMLEVFGLEGWGIALATLILGLVLIVVALIFITKTMRKLLAGKLEQALNRALGGHGIVAIFVGILKLETAFPITLGANIGTTITAMLAALAADASAGLTIALVHLLFNCTGILIVYPIPAVRRIPIRLAEGLAALAVKNRALVLGYILFVFVVLPLLGIMIFQG